MAQIGRNFTHKSTPKFKPQPPNSETIPGPEENAFENADRLIHSNSQIFFFFLPYQFSFFTIITTGLGISFESLNQHINGGYTDNDE